MLDREDVKGPWREHTEHDFVRQMADGTLPLEQFKYYLIQDYLFLVGERSQSQQMSSNILRRYTSPERTLF